MTAPRPMRRGPGRGSSRRARAIGSGRWWRSLRRRCSRSASACRRHGRGRPGGSRSGSGAAVPRRPSRCPRRAHRRRRRCRCGAQRACADRAERARADRAPGGCRERGAERARADAERRRDLGTHRARFDERNPVDPAERRAYRDAHALHFEARDPAGALAAWNRYLAAYPSGRFAIEARYNRALCLVRLDRSDEARAALVPFAEGRHGEYRRREAVALIEALSE